MKFEVNDGIVRGLPLAILVTFLIQAGTLVWWVSAKARDHFFLEQRVITLEGGVGKSNETQALVLQRLVRIEERLSQQSSQLDRMDKTITNLK